MVDRPGGRRVVVKVGSSSLTSAAGGLDRDRLDALVDALASARTDGHELVLVSSGAIASGLTPLGLARRPRDLATQQAAASVGQGVLLHRYTESCARHGLVVGQVLLTADDVVRRAHYRNAQRTLYRLLDLGVLPVVNENDTVATEEIRFGDNDRLAALVAHLVHAELLVLLSDVDGLFESDPRRGSGRLIPEVHAHDDLDGVRLGRGGQSGPGTGGMASKVAAARMAAAAGIRAVVASTSAVAEVLAGGSAGTSFVPTASRLPTRLLWLAYAATPRGRLHLDGGAVSAVIGRRMSLLPAGVVAVDGEFVAGDPVDLLDENGHAVARGLVNFDVGELPALLGRSTPDLARELGPAFSREVVHRDEIVVLG
ncbi:MAG: glutamate 5-kinase [Sporichthyaceae bacterium]|nr:glutamate 5-kinase [Sporichthyaceae bacterium]